MTKIDILHFGGSVEFLTVYAVSILVTMQAQRSAPADMICKDKFLIQGTVVPPGTREEDITSGMVRVYYYYFFCSPNLIILLLSHLCVYQFSKDEGRYVEENKLRVSLISPPRSPDLSPINGTFKQGLSEAPFEKEQGLSGVDIFYSEPMVRFRGKVVVIFLLIFHHIYNPGN